MERARRADAAGLLQRPPGRDRRRRARGRAAARARAARSRARPAHRLRGARVGHARQRLRARVADRRDADHPALGTCLDSFHVLSRGDDPAGIREHPRRADLLPPARRRAAPDDGRPAVEPPPPLLPGTGRLRRRRLPRARARHRLRRPALARSLQRRLPGRRSAADGRRRDALAAGARGRAAAAPRSCTGSPPPSRARSSCAARIPSARTSAPQALLAPALDGTDLTFCEPGQGRADIDHITLAGPAGPLRRSAAVPARAAGSRAPGEPRARRRRTASCAVAR